MKDQNEIEDLFKDKFDDYEPEVSSKVWKNVKTGIKVAGVGVLGKFLINKIGMNAIIAGVSSIVTVVATVTVMNWDKGEGDKIADKGNTKVEVKLPEQATVDEIKEFLNTDGKAEDKIADKLPEGNKIVDGSKQTILPKSIANIQSSATSGVAPLYVDMVNAGSGKKNTWIYGNRKNNNESPMYYFDNPGIYTIKLISTDKNGNTQTDSIKIDVQANSEVALKRVMFTPNGDGKNDYFSVKPENVVQLDAKILDVDGNVVYKWQGLDGKWDGKDLTGQTAKAGTYFYIFNHVDKAGIKAETKGAVELIR